MRDRISTGELSGKHREMLVDIDVNVKLALALTVVTGSIDRPAGTKVVARGGLLNYTHRGPGQESRAHMDANPEEVTTTENPELPATQDRPTKPRFTDLLPPHDGARPPSAQVPSPL